MAASSGAGTTTAQPQLRELLQLIHQIQEERTRNEDNLSNINKTHEKMKNDNKVSPYFKNKLKGLYTTAVADTKVETDLIQQAMDKIGEIKASRNERRAGRLGGQGGRQVYKEESRKGMRRGVLMSMLQQSAVNLPTWSGRLGESAPPLCGAVPAEISYVSRPGDHVAARVKSSDGEEQWILAEVHSYNTSSAKYEVDDIDYSDDVGKPCKERHCLGKRRVIPLPLWKADPVYSEAMFQAKQLVLALYPQTTCFYRALIGEPPKTAEDDYLVLFEDSSYADGYSPPLNVPQRYVVHFRKR